MMLPSTVVVTTAGLNPALATVTVTVGRGRGGVLGCVEADGSLFDEHAAAISPTRPTTTAHAMRRPPRFRLPQAVPGPVRPRKAPPIAIPSLSRCAVPPSSVTPRAKATDARRQGRGRTMTGR